jgi:DNA-binding transcriptional LysR family regulator
LVAREIKEGFLVPLKLDHDPVELNGIFAVHPSARRPPAKVRAAIDFLTRAFGLDSSKSHETDSECKAGWSAPWQNNN